MQDNKQHRTEIENSIDLNNLTEEPVIESSSEESTEEKVEEVDEVTKLRDELEAQKDKYLRLFAEFDNFKRRSARESMELRQTAGKEIIISLLDVMDDCDRAEKQFQTSEDVQQIKEGVLLVFNKLRTALQSRGLKPMETLNKPFDSEKHEAIAEIPAPDKHLKGKVVEEIVKGYYLNDKLIRFAKVVVGK